METSEINGEKIILKEYKEYELLNLNCQKHQNTFYDLRNPANLAFFDEM